MKSINFVNNFEKYLGNLHEWRNTFRPNQLPQGMENFASVTEQMLRVQVFLNYSTNTEFASSVKCANPPLGRSTEAHLLMNCQGSELEM